MKIDNGYVKAVAYGVVGVIFGNVFSKALYNKGKADAYEEIIEELQDANDEIAVMIANKVKEEEA